MRFLEAAVVKIVKIFYEDELIKGEIALNLKVENLKSMVENIKQIPRHIQILKHEEGYELGDEELLENLNCRKLVFQLSVKENVEYYGFNENYPIKYSDFRGFFIETDQEMENIVYRCTFKKEN